MTSTTTFMVKNMRAVGMHHHGPSALSLNTNYRLSWEPDCPEDLGNAMAVRDCRSNIRAYLTRKDAAVISDLCFAGVVVGKMIVRTIVIPHCVEQKLGPQQECSVRFNVKTTNAAFVELLFRKNVFDFISK